MISRLETELNGYNNKLSTAEEGRERLSHDSQAQYNQLKVSLGQIDKQVEKNHFDMNKKINKIAADQTETIQSLVTKADIARVLTRFDDYATTTELSMFTGKINPLVKECRESLDLFVNEHAQMKEMIRRFDECISEKANKMSLVELERRIGDNFLH